MLERINIWCRNRQYRYEHPHACLRERERSNLCEKYWKNCELNRLKKLNILSLTCRLFMLIIRMKKNRKKQNIDGRTSFCVKIVRKLQPFSQWTIRFYTKLQLTEIDSVCVSWIMPNSYFQLYKNRHTQTYSRLAHLKSGSDLDKCSKIMTIKTAAPRLSLRLNSHNIATVWTNLHNTSETLYRRLQECFLASSLKRHLCGPPLLRHRTDTNPYRVRKTYNRVFRRAFWNVCL